MKNKEYWKDRIIEIALDDVGIALKDGVPMPCFSLPCEECDFCMDRECKAGYMLRKWGEEEQKLKTRMDVLLEKYPNATIIDDMPLVCPKMLDSGGRK